MGKMFADMSTEGVEKAEDRVGGYSPLTTGIYDAVIKTAYAGKSSAGARNITLVLDIKGQEYRETIYISNKKGENFYPDKQDPKKKILMPGFSTIDDICLFTTERPLAEQDTETKVVKAWSSADRKEVNTEVPMLVDLLDKPIKVAIQQTKEFKQVLQGGEYVDTNETRTSNTIEKALHPETGRTVNEYMHGVETAEYMKTWGDRNNGVVRDKTRGAAGAGPAAGSTGTGSPFAKADGAAKKSLFGNK
jgi:hypothetical protein